MDFKKGKSPNNDCKQDNFEEFFLYYFPQLKEFIRRILQNSEEAEDIAQDIFVTLWQNRQALENITNMNAYLFRIARNAVYRFIERSLLLKNYQLDVEKRLPTTENLIEEELQAQEMELLIAMAVENMPPQRKKIFKMSREKGMSNDEIANVLNISKRTIENHITQALADIRKVILSFLFTFL